MHDFANILAKTIVYAVLDDFSGNTLMGPTVPNQYRNVKAEKVILKTCDYWCQFYYFSKCNCRRRYGSRRDEYGKESLDDWYIYAGVPVRKVKPRQKRC